ncbi:MAG: PAS domain-containing protein [Planctomycetia bacterium]|nr:PAS domain-containing protein [Planctomycetia bacterium]
MNQSQRRSLRGYGIAISCCVVAGLAWYGTGLWIGNRVTSSYFLVAVIVASRFGGRGPGVLALLSGLCFVTYQQYTLSTRFTTAFYVLIALYFVLALILVLITELERRARDKATDIEARLLLALEAGRMGYWSWDLTTNRVRSSETQAKIHGRPPELTETRIEDSDRNIHPEDRPIVREAIGRAIKNDAPERTTYRVVWPDDSIHWIEAVGRVFCDASGKPNQVIGVCVDITDRKNAEDNLRTREAQLTGILDNTTAVIYLKDPEGRYLIVNQMHRNLFQKGDESLIGKQDADIFPEEVARRFVDSDAAIWRAQAPLDFEEDAPHPDGLHTYRSIKFPVRDEAGKMIALGGISTDVTDLKKAHEALIAKQNLLRNLIEVQEDEKQFLCREFHDGLIQYAVGSLMLLESRQALLSDGPAAPTIQAVIDNLRRGVEDGRRAIRGIRPAVLDDSGLAAAIEDLIGQFENSGIHVTAKCDTEIGRLPETIQTTVYRVVQEALNNAKKHSDTDVIRIEMKQADGNLTLEVRDFGCGFDVAKSRNKGFGLLGMTERVRLLGGECIIESEQDAGTRISVRIPLPSNSD